MKRFQPGQPCICDCAVEDAGVRGGGRGGGEELTSTSAGVSLQFRTSMTVMTSRVASSRRRRRTRTSSSVISGP